MKDDGPDRVYPQPMGKQQKDPNYFARRASEERAAAERALDPRARQSHLDLAERYAEAAQQQLAQEGEEAMPEPQAPLPLLPPEFRILP